MAGSPGRRAPVVKGTCRPAALATDASTDFTDVGRPLPRLYRPDGLPARSAASASTCAVAEALERSASHGGVARPRDYVLLGIVILAEFSLRIRPRRVEVAERRRANAVGALILQQPALDP